MVRGKLAARFGLAHISHAARIWDSQPFCCGRDVNGVATIGVTEAIRHHAVCF